MEVCRLLIHWLPEDHLGYRAEPLLELCFVFCSRVSDYALPLGMTAGQASSDTDLPDMPAAAGGCTINHFGREQRSDVGPDDHP